MPTPHMLPPSVTVIVPTYNDRRRLELCLEALSRQTYSRDQYDVVVVDNASTDDVATAIPTHGPTRVTLASESTPGSYAARNAGIASATGDILAFTDADCVPEPDWLERGVAALSDPDVGVVAGHVDLFLADPARPTAVELFEMTLGHPMPQELLVRQFGFGTTANLITRRSTVRRAGPFDGSLRSGGDLEFCQRVTRAGLAVRYVPDARVRHPARRTLPEVRRRIVRVVGGQVDLMRREPAAFWRRLLGDTYCDFGLAADNLARIWNAPWRARLPVPVRLTLWLQGSLCPYVLSHRALARLACAQRVRILAVFLFFRYVRGYERLRLVLGGHSSR